MNVEGKLTQIDMNTYELTTDSDPIRLIRNQEFNWSLTIKPETIGQNKLKTIGQWRKAKPTTRVFESLVELEREHKEWKGIAELVEPSHFYSGAYH